MKTFTDKSSYNLRITGFVYCFSHDSHFIDRDVSTVYYRSSSGDRIDLLSRNMAVSDW